jgi:hypothetical protein
MGAGEEVNNVWGIHIIGKSDPGRIPAGAVAILEEILDAAYKEGVVQYEHDDTLPPVVTETQVRFNGVDEEGHETFLFDTDARDGGSDGFRFDFCKTKRKPYDEVVMKVLIVLKYYLGNSVKVTSDGEFDKEWADVRAEMAARYGMATFADEQLLVVPLVRRKPRASLCRKRGLACSPTLPPRGLAGVDLSLRYRDEGGTRAMVQRMVTERFDDLDGSPAVETVRFSYPGVRVGPLRGARLPTG